MAEQRYVVIRGEVFTWEEKAPFSPSGHSIAGALEYEPDNDTLRCHECGEWRVSLQSHVCQYHCMDTATYKLAHALLKSTALLGVKSRAQRSVLYRTDPQRTELMRQGRIRRRELEADPTWLAKLRASQKLGASYSRLEYQNSTNRCPAQSIVKLQQLAAELGRTPIYSDDISLTNALQVRFGSFVEAIKIAGLTWNGKAGSAMLYSRNALREGLIDFYVYNGRLPKDKEFGRGGRLACYGTYVRHYGSMKAAFSDAGLARVEGSFSERVSSGRLAARNTHQHDSPVVEISQAPA